MRYIIIYNQETGVVESKVQGDLNLENAINIFTEALKLAGKKGSFLFYSDFTEARVNFSVAEIYEIPAIESKIAKTSGTNIGNYKRAVAFSPTTFTESRFAENVKVNRGHQVMLFERKDEAEKWLFEK